MKDKLGNKLTTKEFFSRWKQGIQAITAFQQVKISIVGNVLVEVGVIIGLISTFNVIWWLFTVLCGSLILVSMSFLATIQRYFALSKIDKQMKEAENFVPLTQILNSEAKE